MNEERIFSFCFSGNVHLKNQLFKIKFVLTFLKIKIMQAGIDTQETI